MNVTGTITRVAKCRWGAVRLLIAGFLLYAMVADTGARLARLQLASMEDVDAIAEVAVLRGQGRFGEALMIADAALEEAVDTGRRETIEVERQKTLDEQASWIRRAKDVGIGAVTGGSGIEPGSMSLEMLIGAIATDMLLIGDVRDLVIQGSRAVRGEDVDEVIVALSAFGVVTTVAPEIDWAPAILKAGRKIGALKDALGGAIVRAAKAGDLKTVESLRGSVTTLAKTGSPATAARALKFAENAEDVAKLASFTARYGKRGARALHATEEGGAVLIKQAEDLRGLGKVDEALALEGVVLKAGAKGERGGRWLRAGGYRAMLRPHPITGLIKSVYKGHATAVVQRAMEALDLRAWWIVPLLAGWVVFEIALIGRRLRGA